MLNLFRFILLRLSLALFVLPATLSWAQNAQLQRSIEMELEPIDGATAYEIELKSVVSKKILNFKMKAPLWKAKVKPGVYELRLRSYDERGVPGDWSATDKFSVNFSPPQMLHPQNAQEIKTGEPETATVEFKWNALPGAKKYKVYVESLIPNGVVATTNEIKTYSGETEKSTLELKLPIATHYKWGVVAILPNGDEGDKPENLNEFFLLGARLEKPEIEKPLDKYVQTLKWDKPNFADQFDYILQRKSEAGWKTIEKKSLISENEINFSNEHPGGQYRIGVRAKGYLREASPLNTVEFKVHTGDRSPAAVEVSRLRESMDKPTNWYAMASYLVTNVDYTGVDAEGTGGDKSISYSAIGGTGRIGVGYFQPEKNNGFIGILDLSGIDIKGENVTFASIELNYARKLFWKTNRILLSAGYFMKELPFTQQNPNGSFKNSVISYSGPHAGFTFWHPFTPKLGLQFNLRAYYSLFSGDTPNGQDIDSELTTQIGAMGSLRLSERLTGFAGVASRIDRAKFKKVGGTGSKQFQEAELNGTYLNLLLEYGF